MKVLATIFIVAMFALNLVPPLFAEGGIFDVTYKDLNDCGEVKTYHGLYFDNVYFTISFFCNCLALFIIPSTKLIGKMFKILSFILLAWFVSALIFEVANFAMPKIILNSAEDSLFVSKIIVCVSLSIVFIFSHLKWTSTKN